MPPAVLAMAIAVPALTFAASVAGAQFVSRRTVPPILGVIVFATLWTAFDYLISSGANGTATSPANSQVGMPFLIQFASIFGLWVVTFLIGFFAASVAMAGATRDTSFALLAVGIFAVNAGYGAWRIGTAAISPVVHVGLAADDSLIGKGAKADEDSALAVVKAYADAVRQTFAAGRQPDRLSREGRVLKPVWRGEAMAELETAAHIGHATVIIGFDDIGAERRNDALVFFPTGAPPLSYNKRRMVPGLESVYLPGQGSFMLTDRTGVAICKDMDFPDTLHQDAMLAPDAVRRARLGFRQGRAGGTHALRSCGASRTALPWRARPMTASDPLATLMDACSASSPVAKAAWCVAGRPAARAGRHALCPHRRRVRMDLLRAVRAALGRGVFRPQAGLASAS